MNSIDLPLLDGQIDDFISLMGNKIDELQDYVTSGTNNVGILVTLVALTGIFKAIAVYSKNNRVTLSLEQKKKMNIIFDKYTALLTALPTIPLLATAGIDHQALLAQAKHSIDSFEL